MKAKEKAALIFDRLSDRYPDAHCELEYGSVFELLVAVILSAQCTDKRVNVVTEKLFKDYNTPEAFASMEQSTLESYIFSCGFYRNKAKNIIAASRDILTRFGGEVPSDFDDLLSLSGVGRKTANVVTAVGFGEPAFAVDTHVFRLSHRLGLSDGKTPDAVEADLRAEFEVKDYAEAHHLLIFHGRYCCKAINPDCAACPLTDICRHYNRDSE